VVDAVVQAWRVHDTGLVAVPSRFRRLGGQVRHLQGHGDAWPDAVTLALREGVVHVSGPAGEVGRWPQAEVNVTVVSAGPPVSFVLAVPDATQLLAAAAGPATDALLAVLGQTTGP
jgi:hypothetical protein